MRPHVGPQPGGSRWAHVIEKKNDWTPDHSTAGERQHAADQRATTEEYLGGSRETRSSMNDICCMIPAMCGFDGRTSGQTKKRRC